MRKGYWSPPDKDSLAVAPWSTPNSGLDTPGDEAQNTTPNRPPADPGTGPDTSDAPPLAGYSPNSGIARSAPYRASFEAVRRT